jgi:hypothetical protein
MPPPKAPLPEDPDVPSAASERKRIWHDDVGGITAYAIIALIAVVAILGAATLAMLN